MAEYRCHYLEDDRRRSQVVVDAPDDATMLLTAEELLAGSGFVAMEVWQDQRLVGRVTVGTPAKLTHDKAGRTHKRAANSN